MHLPMDVYWVITAMGHVHIQPFTFEPDSEEESDFGEEPGMCTLQKLP